MKELVFSRTLRPTLERNATEVGFIDAASGAELTFGEHLSQVARLSNAMSSELGVSPGDRVTVIGVNSVPFLQIWHACLLGAALMNPLNLRFSPDELSFVISDSGSKVCFVDATFAPVIDQIRQQAGLTKVVLMGPGDAPCDIRYDDLLAGAKEQLPAEPEETDPAALIYTGGTTGKPKGVLLEQRAEVLNQYHYAMGPGWMDTDRFITQTPMFHGATMLGIVGAPMFGKSSIIVPMFNPAGSIEATEKYNGVSTVLVPTMIGMMLGHESFDPKRLSSLRRIIYGASPMPRPTLEKLLEALPDTEIIHGYGMTEGVTIVSAFSDADHRSGQRLGSPGRPLMGVEIVAKDESGATLPAGEVGEVCVRAGNIMTEYRNRPEETAAALKDGWYHTGDVGYLDEKGYLFLVDRAKDMIISGGENVYSVEVEDACASHPEIVQVAVIGIPSDQWGEAVHAVCVVKDGCSITEEDVIAHARKAIAGYKCPRSVSFRTEALPLSGANKVLKRELRAPFWEGRERAIN